MADRIGGQGPLHTFTHTVIFGVAPEGGAAATAILLPTVANGLNWDLVIPPVPFTNGLRLVRFEALARTEIGAASITLDVLRRTSFGAVTPNFLTRSNGLVGGALSFAAITGDPTNRVLTVDPDTLPAATNNLLHPRFLVFEPGMHLQVVDAASTQTAAAFFAQITYTAHFNELPRRLGA